MQANPMGWRYPSILDIHQKADFTCTDPEGAANFLAVTDLTIVVPLLERRCCDAEEEESIIFPASLRARVARPPLWIMLELPPLSSGRSVIPCASRSFMASVF